jgi:hypothetical protein
MKPPRKRREEMTATINDASNLDMLCAALNALEDQGIDLRDARVDTTSLPTFGDNEPRDTTGIFSWDDARVMRQGNGGPGQHWVLEKRYSDDVWAVGPRGGQQVYGFGDEDEAQRFADLENEMRGRKDGDSGFVYVTAAPKDLNSASADTNWSEEIDALLRNAEEYFAAHDFD